MTSYKRAQKLHTDDATPRRSTYGLNEANFQPISITIQIIRVVTRHRYGISALLSHTSFRGETSGSVVECRLFSQAAYFYNEFLMIHFQK